jgi:hypothetical protein
MNALAPLEMPKMTDKDEKLTIPLDLSEWIPIPQLRDWIMSNVATLDWTNAELLELLKTHPHFEPKALLNTMTLAYVVGIFGADEIARSCSMNLEFRAIRPKLPPVVSDLKQFRKENRGLLKLTVADVITKALKSQFVEGESIDVFPVGLRRYILENATERLDLARHLDRRDEML